MIREENDMEVLRLLLCSFLCSLLLTTIVYADDETFGPQPIEAVYEPCPEEDMFAMAPFEREMVPQFHQKLSDIYEPIQVKLLDDEDLLHEEQFICMEETDVARIMGLSPDSRRIYRLYRMMKSMEQQLDLMLHPLHHIKLEVS